MLSQAADKTKGVICGYNFSVWTAVSPAQLAGLRHDSIAICSNCCVQKSLQLQERLLQLLNHSLVDEGHWEHPATESRIEDTASINKCKEQNPSNF